MTNAQKVDIAQDFVSLHKDSDIDNWQPMGVFGEEKLLAIYANMVDGEYGECTLEDGFYEVEIGRFEHKDGHAYMFGWDE